MCLADQAFELGEKWLSRGSWERTVPHPAQTWKGTARRVPADTPLDVGCWEVSQSFPVAVVGSHPPAPAPVLETIPPADLVSTRKPAISGFGLISPCGGPGLGWHLFCQQDVSDVTLLSLLG